MHGRLRTKAQAQHRKNYEARVRKKPVRTGSDGTMKSDEQLQHLYGLAVEHLPAAFPAAVLHWLAQCATARPLSWRVLDAKGQLLDERLLPATLPKTPKPWLLSLSQAGFTHELRFAPARGTNVPAEEQTLLAQLLPHLPAAERLCHRMALRVAKAQSSDAADPSVGCALCGLDGAMLHADARFREQLLHAHRFWDERLLPFAIEWQDKLSAQGMVWEGLFFKVDRVGLYYHLRVRKDRRSPELSPREYEIAERIARGKTFKEVARELEVAPSTVSTHLYNLYDKLGIRRRADLVGWLERRRHGGEERRVAVPEPLAGGATP